MGASLSSTRALLRYAAAVCLAVASPLLYSAETRNVTIPVSEFVFVDEFTGNDTTFITMGDTVNWKWGPNPPMDITIEPHTTTSGVCGVGGGDPDCGGRWSSASISSGSFPHTATFATPGNYSYHCHVHFPTFPMSGTIRVERPLDHFEVSASPNPAIAGNVISVTVIAKDSLNQTILGYRGTVHFTSNDGQAILPANSMLTYPTGTKVFNVTLRTSGTRSITVNDVANPTRTGTTNVTVNHAPASGLELTAPAASAAGVPFLVTVRARDAFNNTATGYAGTVQFSSSDPFPALPANSTLNSGTKTFSVTLNSAGSRTLTVTDTVNAALTDTATINVSAATCSTTFSNPTAITIPSSGAGTPYPSTITVAGLNQTISGMSVTLNGVTHGVLRDVDALLVGPGGQKFIIMSDAGGDASNINITLADSAAATIPSSAVLASGSFRPTNFTVGDTFVAPAPPGPYFGPAPAEAATFATVFDGTDPNGTWSLFVVDDLGGLAGSIAGGWSLTFAAPPRTFCNPANISIPSGGTNPVSPPYPSPIEVVGLDGTVKRVSLRLDKFSHSFPTDVDMLLVGPGGQKMIFFSDLGLGTDVTNLVISLDDAAANPVPSPIVSGVFRPSNTTLNDPFAAPAPAPPYANAAPVGTDTFASVFNNTDPNGTWNLFVVDDVSSIDGGSIAGGWALNFDLIFNTTTAVASDITPSIWGQVVTFTASVTSSSGTPTGTVQFRDGAVAMGTPRTLMAGSAQLLWAALTPGSHNITAEYSGDANFNPSTSSIFVQVVNHAPTSTAVISSVNPSTFGQSVTFTATVNESAPSTPTGTVSFLDGATLLGTSTLAGNVATFNTSALTGGGHSITAVYNGNTLFATSTSPALTQTVNKANTTGAVVSSANPSTFGMSVTFTATVSESTAGTATGTVSFRDGTTTLGTGTLNGLGVATFSTSTLAVGSHSINVVYAGDSNFNGSTSPSITQTVNKATPTASVISFLNPSGFTDEVTFRADVSATVTPPAALPTGTVTFRDGAASLGTITLSSGTAQFSTSTLSGGNHNITAVYNGDGNYNTQTSSILVQEVTAAETSTALGSSLNPSSFGQPVTFTATVSSGVGTPAGTVTFMDGATPLGSPAALNGLGIATLTTPSLGAGAHSITAIYNSNGSFATSTSGAVMQEVEQSATTVLLTAPQETSVFREAVTFTVTVDSTTSGTPTGTVTFFDGTTELGSASLDGVGEAAITVTGLPVGRHEITVQYAGDSNFPANTSLVLVHYRSPKPR